MSDWLILLIIAWCIPGFYQWLVAVTGAVRCQGEFEYPWYINLAFAGITLLALIACLITGPFALALKLVRP